MDTNYPKSQREEIINSLLEKDKYVITGEVIEKLNIIEEKLAIIIRDYFEPNENYDEFIDVVLDSEYMPFGKKVRLLESLDIFPNSKMKERFHKLLKIRNYFAHNFVFLEWGSFEKDEKGKMKKVIVNEPILQKLKERKKELHVIKVSELLEDFINAYYDCADIIQEIETR